MDANSVKIFKERVRFWLLVARNEPILLYLFFFPAIFS